jgi:hypothetical protein
LFFAKLRQKYFFKAFVPEFNKASTSLTSQQLLSNSNCHTAKCRHFEC